MSQHTKFKAHDQSQLAIETKLSCSKGCLIIELYTKGHYSEQ